MLLSSLHDWQNNVDVKQVLLFNTQKEKQDFEIKLAKSIKKYGIEYANDTGIGAIIKFRTVKKLDGKWSSVIRSGVTGELIWEDDWANFMFPDLAIKAAMQKYIELTTKTFETGFTHQSIYVI